MSPIFGGLQPPSTAPELHCIVFELERRLGDGSFCGYTAECHVRSKGVEQSSFCSVTSTLLTA